MIDYQNLMATILYWQWEVIKGFNQDNKWSESEGVQPCPTLCDPMNCNLSGSSVHGFSRQEYWSGLPFPSPGDLPDAGIEPGSPTLQENSLSFEPPGKSSHDNKVKTKSDMAK